MKSLLNFLKTTLLGGLVVLFPAYISVLMIIKTLGAASGLLKPISDQFSAGESYRYIFAILIVLGVCFVAGLALRTAFGRIVKRAVERNLLERIPGYAVFRGLAEKLSDDRRSGQFTPALAVVEDALVPACIVERLPNGHCTVFVPTAPTPAMGSIFILPDSRVFEVDATLVQLAACVSKWGAGCGELMAKIKNKPGGLHLPTGLVSADKNAPAV